MSNPISSAISYQRSRQGWVCVRKATQFAPLMAAIFSRISSSVSGCTLGHHEVASRFSFFPFR